MKWFAQGPSNIALIKYMGKLDFERNVPANRSLSLTLPNLTSFVEMENSDQVDEWEPLQLPGGQPFQLSENGRKRFLDHLGFLKSEFNIDQSFMVRSCNNFPSDCGLASSASSFAALTRCAVRAFTELAGIEKPPLHRLASLSQQGSGSSCRSFFEPWGIWGKEGVSAAELPDLNLKHQVIIISHEAKAISSREAHQRVMSSPLFKDRPSRAERRLEALIDHINQRDWPSMYHVIWKEFWDMHQLFETAEEPFVFISDQAKEVLDMLQGYWDRYKDGPLITMDAGPNIHLLYRSDQEDDMQNIRGELMGDYDVI